MIVTGELKLKMYIKYCKYNLYINIFYNKCLKECKIYQNSFSKNNVFRIDLSLIFLIKHYKVYRTNSKGIMESGRR